MAKLQLVSRDKGDFIVEGHCNMRVVLKAHSTGKVENHWYGESCPWYIPFELALLVGCLAGWSAGEDPALHTC